MTIQKIDAGSSSAMVRELWIGDTKEELEIAIESIKRNYPTPGYGTMCREVKDCDSVPGVRRYVGKFFTNMTRFTSCD